MRRGATTTVSSDLLAHLTAALGERRVRTSALDVLTAAVDASHFLLTPSASLVVRDADDVAAVLGIATARRTPVTFRSGGTSLSGQGQSAGLLVDVRRGFRSFELLDDAAQRVRIGPGMTVREVNTRLARHGRKLGPDPASEVACTIGGVVANNSSGMTCGTTQNSYETIDSLVVVLASGTVVDTGAVDANDLLADREPALFDLLLRLTDEARRPDLAAEIRRQFATKNTMGYGLNSLLDHDSPAKVLEHLMVGSEGTLGFVASTVFRTVPVLPHVATGLLTFGSLHEATQALPELKATGPAVIELLDEASLTVCRHDPAHADLLPAASPGEAALLVEYQAAEADELAGLLEGAGNPRQYTADAARRAGLWSLRKGLYAKVAGARPSGTTALLEDIAVPVPDLARVCAHLTTLCGDRLGQTPVIFGHAKDGNIHFLVTEDFRQPDAVGRQRQFTEGLVDLVLGAGGTLKAEHGTGRIMAPFVERQYGTELHGMMRSIKGALDPVGILNPGVVLTDDPEIHLKDFKQTPTVTEEVDRCVECGYCEPVCPSQFLTLTPRQRIVAQRAIADAEASGDHALAARLRVDQTYPVTETCAVDGMCQTTCPVGINTGDLVRHLRREQTNPVEEAGWRMAAQAWGSFTTVASVGMTVADRLPAPAVSLPLRAARAVLGSERVPLLGPDLPAGGARRRPRPEPSPDVVMVPACVGTMFGGGDVAGSTQRLLERLGVRVLVPDEVASLCCSTPWKSKGHQAGQRVMDERLVRSLTAATRGGRLTVISDAASCTEGMKVAAESLGAELDIVDAVAFIGERAGELPTGRRAGRALLHPTCATTQLGINDDLRALAGLVAEEVVVPDAWRCCGFAGDRGMLHPELTEAATRDTVNELGDQSFDLYLSANRTCELGMGRALGVEFEHVLVALDRALS
ncbi:FAD-binding and (Fe-S)-binding domain-containing protein [Aestuariimicrobium soli]|uniref:FAD-binding and (Fe-S)-binding domain-containing protein n=1 Tax=Aestuariimicrobium soli TaxID=2035834 RepID=UPI003EB762B3